MYAVGVSLGGNQLSKCLGDLGSDASFLTAAVSVGAPVDLVAGSEIVSLGANKLYAEMFLSTLKEKVLEKARRFPDLIDENVVKNCSTLYDFDSIYTAPIHGFKSAMDYWTRCSAKPVLTGVKVPLLMLNAKMIRFCRCGLCPGKRMYRPTCIWSSPKRAGTLVSREVTPRATSFICPNTSLPFSRALPRTPITWE